MSPDVIELGGTLAPILGVLLALGFLSYAPTGQHKFEDDEDRQRLARRRRDLPLGTEHVPVEWETHE